MTPLAKSLGIDQLNREQRLALVHEIWDTLDSESHPPLLSEAQRQEIARRVANDDSEPDTAIPWEQVKADALRQLKP